MPEPRQRLSECFPFDSRALPEAASRTTRPNQDLLNRLHDTFWNTFMKLPEPTRTAINLHWDRQRRLAGTKTPALELSSDPSGGARKDVLAATDSLWFRFHPEVLRAALDEVLKALVAHELAHALLQAKGKTFPSDAAEEQAVPFITLGWGYEDQDIDLWMAEVTSSPDLSTV